MRPIKVIKSKDEAIHRLFIDDPKGDLIDRKLRGFDPMVEERPERLRRVREWLEGWEKSLSRRGEIG